MRTWPLLLLGCVYVALSSEDQDLASVQWKGGMTKMDEAGRKAYNGLSTRAQIHGNTAFLCNPRLKADIEATLLKMNMFPKEEGDESAIEPFPSLKYQTEGDCESLQSVVDLTLDHESTLWVLDVGVTFASSQPTTPRCPPKIVGFNIHDGKIVKTISLGNLVGPMYRLQFVVADYSAEGNRYLYVADALTKALIVYDVEKNSGVKVDLPEDIIGEFNPRDVLYLALIKKPTGNNLLFFTYRSGSNLFCIETKNLQEDSSTAKSWDVGKKPAKIIILGTDDWESIYFRYESKADVYKWNTTAVFNEQNFQLVHRGNGVLTPTHALPDYKRGIMRMVESNLVEYLNGDVTPADSVNSLTVMTIAS